MTDRIQSRVYGIDIAPSGVVEFPVILWGGTGQAKVIRPILEDWGARIVAVFDDTPDLRPPFADVDLFEGWAGFQKWIEGMNRNRLCFCIAIGNPHGRVRLALHQRLMAEKLWPVTVYHADAVIAKNVKYGLGCQFMAGAIVNPEVRIGSQCIINTGASVDHECVLEDGVEVGPGATLCGLVQVGVNGWIGAGATVLPHIRIGADAIVGAGAVVTHDVPDGVVVVGVPARPIEQRVKA